MTIVADEFVSVIVPVYNDPSGIRVTLSTLLNQTHSTQKHEILVIDNGSTDETKEVIREFVEEQSNVRLLIEDEIQGSYAARNRGIKEAKGEILAFIDADMWVEESWLEEVVVSMNTHEACYVGLDVEIRVDNGDENSTEKYIKQMQWDIESFLNNDDFAPTACLVIRQELVEKVGPFDDRLISGGDMEFGQRVKKAGFEQRFEPDITVYHPARSSLQTLLLKMFRVGRGLYQYNYYHPGQFNKAIWKQPGSYLPPSPQRFSRRLKQETESSSPVRFIQFFIIAYLVRLSRMAGVSYEYINKSLMSCSITAPTVDGE